MTCNLEIVVAHYNEDLSWLLPWEPYVIVYHKGDRNCNYMPDRFKQWIYLDNVGREGHTYLYHMITRYNSLAGITIFLQGRIEDHPHLTLEEYISGTRKTGFSHVPCIRQKGWEGQLQHDLKWLKEYEDGRLSHARCTFAEFWDYLFGRPSIDKTNDSECRCLRKQIAVDFTKPRLLRWYRVTTRNITGRSCNTTDLSLMRYPCCRPHTLEIFWAGCFGVSREKIHQNPVDFYGKIVPYLSDHSNPEEGHYLERLWYTIFRDLRLLPERQTSTIILGQNIQPSPELRSRYDHQGQLLLQVKQQIKLRHISPNIDPLTFKNQTELLNKIEAVIVKLQKYSI